MLFFLVVLIICLAIGAYAIPQQTQFGEAPQGQHLDRIMTSPNYVNGAFTNTVSTEMLMKGESSLNIMWQNLWTEKARLRPAQLLPIVKTDIKALDKNKDTVIWLGHSSYFIQMGGKRAVVDPVFSNYGAPFSYFNKTFAGTDIYSAADMPELDFLLITHDHWDHLDYQSALDLMPKVKKVIVPLGVGAHFARWGYPKKQVLEADWDTTLHFEKDFTVHVVTARHFSGRSLERNKTLWAGFVLETPQRRVFFSGDSGFGPHFAEIAKRFHGFDLVLLDSGQYDPRWPYIHMTPEEAVTAAQILKAQAMLPGHAGRFAIAAHAWDEPFMRAVKASEGKSFTLVTPKIGEAVLLEQMQHFPRWWEGLK